MKEEVLLLSLSYEEVLLSGALTYDRFQTPSVLPG